MPHIVVEYTPNLGELPFDAMLAAVTRNLAASPEVTEESDLQARVLRELGARYESGPAFQPFAVRDGRLVTGQNPASSEDVARLTLEAIDSPQRTSPR